MEREDAVRVLYEREYDTLCRAAHRMLGNWDTAQDLVQDTFLLALLRQDELPDHPAPGAWLMQTLRYLIQNERRKLLSHSAVPLDDAGSLVADEPLPSLDDALPTGLSPRERELLIWRFEQELSYREIAQRLGSTEGACRVKLFRTMEKCRKLLFNPH